MVDEFDIEHAEEEEEKEADEETDEHQQDNITVEWLIFVTNFILPLDARKPLDGALFLGEKKRR